MRAYYKKYKLNLKRPAGTSRGVLYYKETWFLYLEDNKGVYCGECNLFRGLGCDDVPEYEYVLENLCREISVSNCSRHELSESIEEWISKYGLCNYPSIIFGLEMALKDNNGVLFPSLFTLGEVGVPINGLIWMGDIDYMTQQIHEKLQEGFKVLKLKIGALDWTEELSMISEVRRQFSVKELEIRVDANGAFKPETVMNNLELLAKLDIHSIEQPIKSGQWEQMRKLCMNTPIPIALDEELIGINKSEEREGLLTLIRPHYIILKPSLLGGFAASKDWICKANKLNIKWWITSALESNVGLNAIAQFTYTLNNTMPHGLGTGGLYTNNISSTLRVDGGKLWFK